jgi:hypothetical protein
MFVSIGLTVYSIPASVRTVGKLQCVFTWFNIRDSLWKLKNSFLKVEEIPTKDL